MLNKLWIHLLKRGWQCCFSKPFLLSPLPPSNVESTENDLNAWHQHCIGGRGRRKIRHFYGFIAPTSQEFWPGLSENLFVRKLSLKLYEAWHFWGVRLVSCKLYCFPLSDTCPPPKTYVAEIWSWLKTRHFSPLLTLLWFWLKQAPSTASTPAWWRSGGGFTTFGIKYHRRSSRSWFHVVPALPSSFWIMQVTEPLRHYGVTSSVRHPRYPQSFLGYISHSRFSLKWFSNVFCEVSIVIVVKKSHCPLILCWRGFFLQMWGVMCNLQHFSLRD